MTRPARPDAWKADALCVRVENRDAFFPEKASGEVNRGEDGKAVCARCPVARACMIEALRNREKHGIWGGAGEPTRRRLGKLVPKGYTPPIHAEGCLCGTFCISLTDHLEGLARAYAPTTGEPIHGRWEAYLHAGCRCVECSQAYKASGRETRGRPPKAGPGTG